MSEIEPEDGRVQTRRVKQLRIADLKDRPDDVILEISSKDGTAYYVLSRADVEGLSKALYRYRPKQEPQTEAGGNTRH